MKRRTLFAMAAIASPVSSFLLPATARAATRKTFVLLHGAFHGGWCWAPVADLLRAQGHRVFTPSYTGSGERAHLLNASIDLNTYIDDVVAVIEAEELQQVILVAHSFGGYVASSVIDRMPERFASAVYLDAPMGTNGKSVLDEAPPDVRKARLDATKVVAGTRVVAAPNAKAFGLLVPAQVAWVNRRMTPMPLAAYQTPMVLKNPPGGNLSKRFIHCVQPALPNIAPSARYAREHGWAYSELQTGHDAMVSMPDQVANLLLA